MGRSWRLGGVAVMALLAAACGTDPQERTSGGAAAGAATGAGIGALGGPVGALAGAGIGAGAGAIAGSQTSPGDINLGRPPWTNPEVRTPPGGAAGGSATRAQTSRNTAAARQPRDRAYRGGGMVGGSATGSGMGEPAGAIGGGAGTMTPGSNTGSTGPGGTSNLGSGNQPGTGGTSSAR